jgi:hypothetical protein
MEYLVRQYGGGPLTFADKITNTAQLMFEGENPLIREKVRKVPFVSRFYQDTDNPNAVTGKYFKNRNEILKASQIFENYLDKGNDAKADEFYEKNQDKIELKPTLDLYEKEIKKLRKDINKVKEEFPEEVKYYEMEKEKVMKDFNREVNRNRTKAIDLFRTN